MIVPMLKFKWRSSQCLSLLAAILLGQVLISFTEADVLQKISTIQDEKGRVYNLNVCCRPFAAMFDPRSFHYASDYANEVTNLRTGEVIPVRVYRGIYNDTSILFAKDDNDNFAYALIRPRDEPPIYFNRNKDSQELSIISADKLRSIGLALLSDEVVEIDDDKGGGQYPPHRRRRSSPVLRQLQVFNYQRGDGSSDECVYFRVISVAIAYDAEFCQHYRGLKDATEVSIHFMFPIASSFFENDFCVRLRLSAIIQDSGGECSLTDSHYRGFNKSACAGTTENPGYLREFATFMQLQRQPSGIDDNALIHMLSGAPSPDAIYGCAFQAGLCKHDEGYGLSYHTSESTDMPISQALLLAHEIGHNLGAVDYSLTEGENYIMEEITNDGSGGFSQSSIDQMLSVIDAVNCDSIELVPTLAPRPTLTPSENPNDRPSYGPSLVPTMVPSDIPSLKPSEPQFPSISHGPSSSFEPSSPPSATLLPSGLPSEEPTALLPSQEPSTLTPSQNPTDLPTSGPSQSPSLSTMPTNTIHPSTKPTLTSSPTRQNAPLPQSEAPSVTKEPTFVPSMQPSTSTEPAFSPSVMPSAMSPIPESDCDYAMSKFCIQTSGLMNDYVCIPKNALAVRSSACVNNDFSVELMECLFVDEDPDFLAGNHRELRRRRKKDNKKSKKGDGDDDDGGSGSGGGGGGGGGGGELSNREIRFTSTDCSAACISATSDILCFNAARSRSLTILARVTESTGGQQVLEGSFPVLDGQSNDCLSFAATCVASSDHLSIVSMADEAISTSTPRTNE
jgi:hypothetical protein